MFSHNNSSLQFKMNKSFIKTRKIYQNIHYALTDTVFNCDVYVCS